ncbi:MAG: hypothetical protein KDA86_09915 [Planctomycetaceae bacterium]|nr:hypothetical protein [Planctomycetaceae bacterium]
MAVNSQTEFQSKAGDRVLIRSAIADDAFAIIEHLMHVSRESSYLITEPDEVKLTEEQEREWIDAHTSAPTSLLLVAEVNRWVARPEVTTVGSRSDRTIHTPCPTDFGSSFTQ